MARLKLLAFAVSVLALWWLSLSSSADGVASRNEAEAVRYASRAADAVGIRLYARRVEVQGLALRLSGTPALYTAAAVTSRAGKADAPTAERFNAIRQAVFSVVPESEQATVVLGFNSGAGALYAKGTAEPSESLDGVSPDAMTEASAVGVVHSAFEVPHLFFSLPLSTAEKVEGRPTPFLVFGVPLVVKANVEEVAKELELEALGIAFNGKFLHTAGAERALLDVAFKKALPGKSSVLSRAAVGSAGPFSLPLGSGKDGPARDIGLRQTLVAAPVEMVAVTRVTPAMRTLADSQKMGLWSFLVSLGLAAAALVWMGGRAKGPRRSDDAELEGPAPVPTQHEPMESPPAFADSAPTADPFGMAPAASGTELMPMHSPLSQAAQHDGGFDFPPAPEPSFSREPDAFGFGQSIPPARHAEPSLGGMPFPPAPLAAQQGYAPFDFDSQPTTAYPVPPVMDAFGQLSGQDAAVALPGSMNGDGMDFNPDATRVSNIPLDLLAQSARPSSDFGAIALPAPRSLAAPTSVAAMSISQDDQHFQDVYRDFVATRQRCGEGADGLTFEKFSQKLRKNREQLMQKYACRTVRFQVYVKEGKAALKATPVKE